MADFEVDFNLEKPASSYVRNKKVKYVSPHKGISVTPSIVKYAEVLHKNKAGTRTAYNYKKELADLKKQLVLNGQYSSDVYSGDLKIIGYKPQAPDPEYNAIQLIENKRRAKLILDWEFKNRRNLDPKNLSQKDKEIYNRMFNERVEDLNKQTFRGPREIKYTREFQKNLTLEMYKETVEVKVDSKYKDFSPTEAQNEFMRLWKKSGITTEEFAYLIQYGHPSPNIKEGSKKYSTYMDMLELRDIYVGAPAVDKTETKEINKYRINTPLAYYDEKTGNVSYIINPYIKHTISYFEDRYDPIYEKMTIAQKSKSRTKQSYLNYIARLKFTEAMEMAGLKENQYRLAGGKDTTSFRWAVMSVYKLFLSEAAKVSLGASLKGVKITHYDPEHRFFEIRIGGVDTKTFRPSGLLVHLSDPVTRNLTNKHRGWIDDAISRILTSRFSSTIEKETFLLEDSYSGRIRLVGDKIAYGVRILKFVHEI